MAQYRLYFMESHAVSGRINLRASSDRRAIQAALALHGARADVDRVELWCGTREIEVPAPIRLPRRRDGSAPGMIGIALRLAGTC